MVAVRLILRVFHKLYIEIKVLSQVARYPGHTVEYGVCGEQVPLDQAWPDNRKQSCHPPLLRRDVRRPTVVPGDHDVGRGS